MGDIFKQLIKKHGFGFVMAAVATDGYRRTVINDITNQKLETIRKEREALLIDSDAKAEYAKNLAETNEKAKNSAVMGRLKEAADEHQTAADAYSKNPSPYSKN